MQAVLVGMAGDRKLYYIIDAKKGEEDGALVTSDGRVMNLDFFSFVNKTRGLKKIASSEFHRFLWGAPSEASKKKWVDTFIMKTLPLDAELTNGLSIQSSIDKKPIHSK